MGSIQMDTGQPAASSPSSALSQRISPRPVTNWNGLVEISCPDAATPYKTVIHAQSKERTSRAHGEQSQNTVLLLPLSPLSPQDRSPLCMCTYDDGALAPSLMAALKGSAHEIDVSNGLDREVDSSVGQVDDHLLDRLVAVVLGVQALQEHGQVTDRAHNEG